jgi:hypothetical protein
MPILPSPAEAEGIWRGIWLEEAHHSTAIEGNTLVMKQVEALLAEGRAVGNKELSEYLEVRGYANAADWVYGHAIQPGEWGGEGLLSVTELRHVHVLTMTPVWDVAPHSQATAREGPGSFREHDIEPFPEGMTPPPWPDIPAAITSWVDDIDHLRQLAPCRCGPRSPQGCEGRRWHLAKLPGLGGRVRSRPIQTGRLRTRTGAPSARRRRPTGLESDRRRSPAPGDQGPFPGGEGSARKRAD